MKMIYFKQMEKWRRNDEEIVCKTMKKGKKIPQ